MERDRDRSEGAPLVSVMFTARLGGSATRPIGEDHPVARNEPPPPSKAGLWERLSDWLRLT